MKLKLIVWFTLRTCLNPPMLSMELGDGVEEKTL